MSEDRIRPQITRLNRVPFEIVVDRIVLDEEERLAIPTGERRLHDTNTPFIVFQYNTKQYWYLPHGINNDDWRVVPFPGGNFTAPPYRADVLVSDWIGSGQRWELIIHPTVHKQENVKQLVVFFFDQNNINILVPYRVDGIGTVTIFSTDNIPGYVIVSDLRKSEGTTTAPGNGQTGGDVRAMYTVINQTHVGINHNLNKIPSVEIRNQAGKRVETKITYPDMNNVVAEFLHPFTGSIHLN